MDVRSGRGNHEAKGGDADMNWAQQWTETVIQALRELGVEIAQFIPNLLGMLFILGAGFLTAMLLGRTATGIARRVGFDRAAERTGVQDLLRRASIQRDASRLVGGIVFWLILLTFVISAADALGLNNVSDTVDAFVRYLPNVLGSLLLLVAGLMVAGVARDVVRGGTERLGIEYARALGQLVHGVLIVLVTSLAIGQLGIETALINRVIEILLLGAGAALALTLGLGTRDVTRHVVAGAYARDVYKPGMRLRVSDLNGQLVDVGTVSTRIATDDGETLYIPNGDLLQSVVRGTPAPRTED